MKKKSKKKPKSAKYLSEGLVLYMDLSAENERDKMYPELKPPKKGVGAVSVSPVVITNNQKDMFVTNE